MSRGNVLLSLLFASWIFSSFVIGVATVQQPPMAIALDYLDVPPPSGCLTDSECDDLAED